MESGDGFRRRTAITLTPQNQQEINKSFLAAAEASSKYLNNNSHVKFERINKINHAILRQRKKEQ